jgi:hypothetical protein
MTPEILCTILLFSILTIAIIFFVRINKSFQKEIEKIKEDYENYLENDKNTIKIKQFEGCYITISPAICEYIADEYQLNGANFLKDQPEMIIVRDLMLSGI